MVIYILDNASINFDFVKKIWYYLNVIINFKIWTIKNI